MWRVFLVSLLIPLGSRQVLPSFILPCICALPPVFINKATFPGNGVSSHVTYAFIHILILATVSFLLPRSRLRIIFVGFPRAIILLVLSRLSFFWPHMGRMDLS